MTGTDFDLDFDVAALQPHNPLAPDQKYARKEKSNYTTISTVNTTSRVWLGGAI